jgi:hypothetical protein
MIVTNHGQGYRVYLYRNPTLTATPSGKPKGTGENFTLY